MKRAGSAADQLPSACTLGPDDGAARMRRWKALSAKGRPSAQRSGHLLEVRYPAQADLRDELQALAAAERQCCSFAEWRVSQEDEHLVLHITTEPGRSADIAAIAALFHAD